MRAVSALLISLSIAMSSGCVRRPRTESLHQAASIGSVSEVHWHLEDGADVNGSDGGWTALAAAAYYGHDHVVNVLLEAGAEPNRRGDGPKGVTPLEAAVHERRLSTVKLLLEAGATPPGRESPFGPILVCAAGNNDVAIVRALLDHGAGDDPGVTEQAAAHAAAEGSTDAYELLVTDGAKPTLVAAAEAGSTKLVQRLLDAGEDPDGPPGASCPPLYVASAAGHVGIVSRLIEAGADVEATTEEGWAPLATAVYYGHDDVVVALLDGGADLDSRDGHPRHDTPLELAVKLQRLATVGLLLQRGASLGPPLLPYWPILIEAATRGDPIVIKLLLDHRAGESPATVQEAAQHAAVRGHRQAFEVLVEHGAKPTLASAAALGDEKAVARLLDAGADPDEMVVRRFLPLHAAARHGHVRIVTQLLDAGADIERGMRHTPLGTAAWWGQGEVVAALVEAGADVNGRGEYGHCPTPLDAAIESEETEIVSLLLELGADPTVKGRSNITMPLSTAAQTGNVEIIEMLLDSSACSDADVRLAAEWALRHDEPAAYDALIGGNVDVTLPLAAAHGDAEVVRRLISDGADVNQPSEAGSPPLVLAAKHGRTDIVKVLLDAGADVNGRDSLGRTALHTTARLEGTEIARLLLAAGANVSAVQNTGGTPLHEAALGCHEELIRLLVKRGADPNARAGWGKSRPLHTALYAQHPAATIRLLIELGADPNAIDVSQVTPLHAAVKDGQVEAARALLEAGANPDLPNNGGNTARDLAEMFDRNEIMDLIEQHHGRG
ncbi:MAG: ankyrin repeat domain-containing protein [Armatimonadota bacterium]|nr:ankyrin repeat domain-containing protein [Armatimonadota bacterium]